ncbi:hypothetical protein Baya_9553 [Bagarius yarrelli]|uniref:Interleukin-11 n=1 Tax=Bagarius yarrelli TaxID=175774 RepID=A0A556U9D3_BAGYA|nr:hypothetical protein Baya_9553 [Bagarius yarrelli]
MSRPTPVSHRKDNLRKLFQQMLRLMSIVQEGVHHFDSSLPINHNLTSLPTLKFRPSDLAAVKAKSTLSQLHSGLQSFQLHFDWLLYWHNQSALMSDSIKKIANAIRSISILKENQTDSPTQTTVLSLPPITSAWDLHQTAAVVHKRLLVFCNWYIRALSVLISQANK